ncbi:MAG: hypothetical protein ABIN69_05210 [Aestuariivirga sp.]|jgi:hypothetical protein
MIDKPINLVWQQVNLEVEMALSLSAPLLGPQFLGPQFNDFLFASVGEEKNGMMLSVVSALARLDLDAWQESAELARLPRPLATERLEGLIAALPNEFLVHRDPAEIASRLIARLPRQTYSDALTGRNAPGLTTRAAIQTQTFIFVALVLMLLIENLGLAGSKQAALHDNNASAPMASGAAPQLPIKKGSK